MLDFADLNRAFPKIGTVCFYMALAGAAWLVLRGSETAGVAAAMLNGRPMPVPPSGQSALTSVDKLVLRLVPASVLVLCLFFLRK